MFDFKKTFKAFLEMNKIIQAFKVNCGYGLSYKITSLSFKAFYSLQIEKNNWNDVHKLCGWVSSEHTLLYLKVKL